MKITFALVGNQNSGKSTLFNQLTGSNQHGYEVLVVQPVDMFPQTAHVEAVTLLQRK